MTPREVKQNGLTQPFGKIAREIWLKNQKKSRLNERISEDDLEDREENSKVFITNTNLATYVARTGMPS